MCFTACTQQGNKILSIGTNVWPGYEPLHLAQYQGYWDKKLIRLAEYQSATEVIRAFRNNNIDAASLTLDEALLLRQDKIPVKVILVHDISHGGDVIVARSPIKNVRDLRNKSIAVEKNALGAFVISRALEIHGIPINKISIINGGIEQQEALFSSKKVDAVVTFEPVRTRLLRKGAREIFTSKEMPDEIVDVLVVRDEVIKSHPKLIQQVTSGWFRALEYMHTHKQVSAKIISQRLKISPAEVINSYNGLIIPDRRKNISMLHSSNATLNFTLKKLKDVLVKNSLLDENTRIDNMLDARFVKQ